MKIKGTPKKWLQTDEKYQRLVLANSSCRSDPPCQKQAAPNVGAETHMLLMHNRFEIALDLVSKQHQVSCDLVVRTVSHKTADRNNRKRNSSKL